MKIGQIAQLAFIALAAVAVYAFVTVAQDGELRRACVPLCAMRPTYAGLNRTAPDFELPDMNGNKVRLSQFAGKTVVLNFWTKTCRPCLEEMPSLGELAKVVEGNKDVVVLTVSTDEGPDAVRDTLKALLRSDTPPFPVLFDPDAAVVGGKFGTKLFPETWIIDPRGVVRARFDGARDWTNALVLDLVDAFRRPTTCGVEFRNGTAAGPFATLCEEGGEG